jgi:hypothetical protein
MRPSYKQRLLLQRLGRLKSLVVIAALVVTSWYVPSSLSGRHKSVMSRATRAVAADATVSFATGRATEPLHTGTPPGDLIANVDIRRKALSGWHVVGDARVQERDDKLFLSLERGTVTSAPLSLSPGAYEIVIDAKIQAGGLQFGFASASSDLCAANAFLSSRTAGERLFPLVLNIQKAGRYYVVFRSWPGTERSAAVVRGISVRDTSELLQEQARARYYSRRASPPPQSSWKHGAVDARWKFGAKIPSDWFVEPGIKATDTPSGLLVRTRPDEDYALVSPKIILDPLVVTYVISVKGRVLRGGLVVSLLDVKKNKFLAHGLFWGGQRGPYMFAFKPVGPVNKVRIILSNWSPSHRSSSWALREVTLSVPY